MIRTHLNHQCRCLLYKLEAKDAQSSVLFLKRLLYNAQGARLAPSQPRAVRLAARKVSGNLRQACAMEDVKFEQAFQRDSCF